MAEQDLPEGTDTVIEGASDKGSEGNGASNAPTGGATDQALVDQRRHHVEDVDVPVLADDVLQLEAILGKCRFSGEVGLDLGRSQGEQLRVQPRARFAISGVEIGRFLTQLLIGGVAQILVRLEIGIDVEPRHLQPEIRLKLQQLP